MSQLLSKDDITPSELDLIKSNSDKIQRTIFESKRSLWYFADNIVNVNDSLLGYLLSSKLDKNFIRIKNLTALLGSDANALKVNISSESTHAILRQEVYPLSKDRIVKIYFTTSRCLYFEMFDTATGACVNTLNAYKNLSSFPISHAYGNHFCVCFTSKDSEQHYYDMNTNFIRLYDTDFNLIKSLQRFTSIESIYMNENYVMIFYSHKVEGCCEVYDYKMNALFSFGQQSNPTAPFYMEKSSLTMKQQMILNYKLNPKVFGFTDIRVYLCNYNKVFIMCRKTGMLLKSLCLHGSRPYFLLDSQNNIIVVNSLAKKIALYNNDLEMVIESVYNDNLDTVHINKHDQMAFVDMEKKTVVYI